MGVKTGCVHGMSDDATCNERMKRRCGWRRCRYPLEIHSGRCNRASAAVYIISVLFEVTQLYQHIRDPRTSRDISIEHVKVIADGSPQHAISALVSTLNIAGSK